VIESEAMRQELPLAGVVVLDFTRAVAGPFCTMLMGDLGARVIKVEEVGHGDETRAWGPPFVEDSQGRGWSTYFVSMNRNKQSIALDLKSGEGLAAAGELARRADVIIENFRPGVAERLGIGYPSLSAGNPSLIYCSVSGFGQTGPWSTRPGYDLMVQAMSGFMHTSAPPSGVPVKAAFPVADILTGLFAEQAILAALYARERTGVGRRIEVSLLHSMLAAMAPQTAAYLMTSEEPPQVGHAQPNIVPYQAFRCADGYLVAGAPNERLWERFCRALERPEWLSDPRFASNPLRNQHRDELVREIESTLSSKRCADVLDVLMRHEIPCAPVSKVGETLTQLEEQGGCIATFGDHEFTATTMAHPARIEGAAIRYRRPPLVGEHTQVILDALKDDSDGL
jgi:crotonobetainyl-CoA:carnitine CoA-transferase CaiB-like acyl-CoA transferase